MNLADLMAHEDADTGRKVKSGLPHGKSEKEEKSRKKRPQPESIWRGWNEGDIDSRISTEPRSGDLKLAPEVGMSDAPSKRPKMNKTEQESIHTLNKINLLVAKTKDIDEDYDDI